MSLTVSWTTLSDGERTRDSGDPLGFRAYANRVARRLVPGLTGATARARGFSLLCLGVQLAAQASDETDAGERFQRLERLWIGAQAYRKTTDAVPGIRRARQYIQEEFYPLDRPVLHRSLTAGVCVPTAGPLSTSGCCSRSSPESAWAMRI